MTQRSDLQYISTKTYEHNVGLSCCFRQWRADSHCKFMHGYALQVKVVFTADKLDQNGWVVDFGSLKSFKTWLESKFDHKCLVAQDDPARESFKILHDSGIIDMRIVDATGCEAFAQMVYSYLGSWLVDNKLSTRVRILEVEVREHGANSAIVRAK